MEVNREHKITAPMEELNNGDNNLITSQPIGTNSNTNTVRNCPRGLEYLSQIDQLLIKEEVSDTYDTRNRYAIRNALGQEVYYAMEESDACERCCLNENRSFDITVLDNFQNEVIHLYRPSAGCGGCLADLPYMEVSSPPGHLIGIVEPEITLMTPIFNIKNQNNEILLRIEGEAFSFGDTQFSVLNLSGQEIGVISKQWSGLMREMFTNADYFGVNFPLDLDVRVKALLLGAVFYIDMKYFEK